LKVRQWAEKELVGILEGKLKVIWRGSQGVFLGYLDGSFLVVGWNENSGWDWKVAMKKFQDSARRFMKEEPGADQRL